MRNKVWLSIIDSSDLFKLSSSEVCYYYISPDRNTSNGESTHEHVCVKFAQLSCKESLQQPTGKRDIRPTFGKSPRSFVRESSQSAFLFLRTLSADLSILPFFSSKGTVRIKMFFLNSV